MADKIVFNYTQMSQCVTNLTALAKSYKEAGETLQTSFSKSIGEWTGASKDAMAAFMSQTVKNYTVDSIPSLIDALAQMLQANIDSMGDADAKIAQSIQDSMG